MSVQIPEAAVEAAAEAMRAQGRRDPWLGVPVLNVARAALDAAAPAIRAAERERIARLAEECAVEYECSDACQGEFWRPFARLIREAS